jgi:hypothetical protein
MKDIEIESIGSLQPDPDDPDECFISKPISVPFFNGKKLKFILVGTSSENTANFLADANAAILNFLKKGENERKAVSHLVFKNYADFVEAVGEEDMPTIENEGDVWSFVYPQEIYVSRRHRHDKDIYLQIACECEWEIEHGLQLVFRRGKKITRVSDQDGHLTEADAYNKRDEDDELLSKF